MPGPDYFDGIISQADNKISGYHHPGWCAQWIEFQPVNQKVAGSIPNQGLRLGCELGSLLGACERQSHIDVSLLLFPLSLKINLKFF